MAGLASSIALSLCPSPRLELNPKVPVVVLRQQTLLRLVGDAVVNNEQIQVQERTQAERHQNSRKSLQEKAKAAPGLRLRLRRPKDAEKKRKKAKKGNCSQNFERVKAKSARNGLKKGNKKISNKRQKISLLNNKYSVGLEKI